MYQLSEATVLSVERGTSVVRTDVSSATATHST
eukprot:COSAG01_NODE_72612_length_252_cov_1.052288_1_plen_32_part_10